MRQGRNVGPGTRIVRALSIVGLVAFAAEALPAESQLPPETLKAVRSATYEVVLKKPEKDDLQYERPLPLDQLPFSQRNDKYESIGTAFAIGRGRFVTAAHVTNVANASLWGVPAIRDEHGHVYPLDKVLKYSLHEDFIVFTAAGAPAVAPLPTSTTYAFDSPVHAVGNALGQGIVARDGTLTSETPEDQDGRWKWLRFSAAASPGNSGGPLLDAQGRVIGIIARKSQNENLNYALPIALVLEAPDKATMDVRYTVALPFLVRTKQALLKATFDLPLPFAEFDRRYLSIVNQQGEDAEQQLLKESSGDLFPRGRSAKVLGDPFLNSRPGFVTQQADGSWDLPRGSNGASTPLGGDGFVWSNTQPRATVFHIHYPSELDVQKVRGDTQLLAEQVLKGIPLNRVVGTERVRVVSVGKAAKSEDVRDSEGRQWKLLRYPLMYSDTTLLVMALPMPDGYVGYACSTGEGSVPRIVDELKLMADYLQTPYTGTLPRWRAFLAERNAEPESFGKWRAALDPAGEVTLDLPRVSIRMNRNVLALSEQSTLTIVPGQLRDGDRFAWDVLAVQFNLEPTGSAAVVVARRPHPAEDATADVARRWTHMTTAAGRYTGKPLRDAQAFYIARAMSADGTTPADAGFLYDVSYVTPTIRVPGEVPRAGLQFASMVTVREK
jgi:hypothetical protein